MGLVLKYVQSTKAGTLHYRRKVPLELRPVVGSGEFKRLLGASEREALLNYPKVNADFERLIAEARRGAGTGRHANSRSRTPLDDYMEARSRLAEVEETLRRLDPDEAAFQRDIHADTIFDSHPKRDRDTGHPVDLPEPDRLLANALRNQGQIEKPAPTLEDAKRLYLRDKVRGGLRDRQKTLRVARAIALIEDALGKGAAATRTLESLERADAREVREAMLADRGMNPATVRRYMNDIRAIVTHGIREFGLRGVENPFARLTIENEVVARDERKPFSPQQIKAVRARLAIKARADLLLIWRVLEGTGCRLGEVAGLLVSDVHTEGKLPYLDLVFHPHRRLKNLGSVRRVPLVGDALDAANEALEAAGEGPLLFSAYGGPRGADIASATLMKHVRAVVPNDRKIVVHSLRHTMEDRLISANVSEFDRNLVLGHTQGTMGERYGGAEARLEAATRAMEALSAN